MLRLIVPSFTPSAIRAIFAHSAPKAKAVEVIRWSGPKCRNPFSSPLSNRTSKYNFSLKKSLAGNEFIPCPPKRTVYRPF